MLQYRMENKVFYFILFILQCFLMAVLFKLAILNFSEHGKTIWIPEIENGGTALL
jgi:hypothetical protein